MCDILLVSLSTDPTPPRVVAFVSCSLNPNLEAAGMRLPLYKSMQWALVHEMAVVISWSG